MKILEKWSIEQILWITEAKNKIREEVEIDENVVNNIWYDPGENYLIREKLDKQKVWN